MNITGVQAISSARLDRQGRGAELGPPPHLTPSAPQQDYLSIISSSSLETARVDKETQFFLFPKSSVGEGGVMLE